MALAVTAAVVLPYLAGCGGTQVAPPTRRVYVNLATLTESRPEWNGVLQIGRQLADADEALRAAGRPIPGPPISHPAVPVAPAQVLQTPRPSPHTAAIARAVAASTPSAEAIRAELLRETEGELQLYDLAASLPYEAERETTRLALRDNFARQRAAILQKYRQRVTDLLIHAAVLKNAAESHSGVAAPAVMTAGSGQTLPQEQAAVRSQIDAALAEQSAALMEDARLLRQALLNARTHMTNQVAEDIARHRAQNAALIDEEVQDAMEDVAQERANRRSLFAHTFQSPLASPLTIQLFTALPELQSLPASASPTSQAVLAAQRTALIQQQQALAQFLLEDTRDFVSAVAKQRNWTVVYKPDPRLPEVTSQVAGWLRVPTVP